VTLVAEPQDAEKHTDPLTIQVAEWEQVSVPPEALLRDGCLEVYPEVVGRDYFTLRQHPGDLRLQAGGHIGLIPLNDRLTLEVMPRVPLGNLGRMMHIAQGAPKELNRVGRRYGLDASMYASLIDVYSRALAGYIDDIVLNGLLKEYHRREEDTSFPRGRIEIGRTATTLIPRGITHRLSTSWFERTADNPANRCLKYAVWYLAQCKLAGDRSRGTRETVRLLNRTYQMLPGVELDRSCQFLDDPTVTGRQALPSLRSYYRDPLDLALLVIRQQAPTIHQRVHGVYLPTSLIVDMSTIFEAYIRRLLQLQAVADHWGFAVLDGNQKRPQGGGKPLFDSGLANLATPDVVLATGTPQLPSYPLLIEVKYKPAGGSPGRDDLNQTIAYAVSYQCNKVVIVQPRSHDGGPPPGLRVLGTIGNHVVYQYVFELAADDLPEEENRFSDAVELLATAL
jgi:5-methylcytosine-specific restriction enzyme subunit McrC